MTEGVRRAWRRVGLVLLVAVVFLLVAGLYPFRQLRTSSSDLARTRAELEARQAERAELERRAERLEQPDEVERLARERFGLARKGEKVFVVVPDDVPSR